MWASTPTTGLENFALYERRPEGRPPYNRTRTFSTFLSKNGSEKRRRDDATFRRSLDGRNLHEGWYRCGEIEAREGSRETMGFTRRFLWYFLFADEKKVRTFPLRADDIRPYNIRGNFAQKGTGGKAPVPFAMGNVYEERKNPMENFGKPYAFSTTSFSSRSKIFAVSPFWRLPSSICSATASSTVD